MLREIFMMDLLVPGIVVHCIKIVVVLEHLMTTHIEIVTHTNKLQEKFCYGIMLTIIGILRDHTIQDERVIGIVLHCTVMDPIALPMIIPT
jgi:hypothetical protein